jgi:hypothetical protein
MRAPSAVSGADRVAGVDLRRAAVFTRRAVAFMRASGPRTKGRLSSRAKGDYNAPS